MKSDKIKSEKFGQQESRVAENGHTEMVVYHGDITKLAVDAIVNAANENLSGGDGVDGAIHKAAGPSLAKECQSIGGCQAGESVITKGYKLPAKYVIHTVGPKYGSSDGNEDKLLANCYLNSLRLGFEHNLRTIAFPNISTGVYRYPKEEATEIALRTVLNWINEHSYYSFEKIYFVSYTEEDYELNLFFIKQLGLN